MKKIFFFKIVAMLIFLLQIFNSCKNYSERELIGAYVNNYDENTLVFSIPEAPSRIDTLILFENNKFSSQYFGEGEYCIYELNGYQILNLKYIENGMHCGFGLTIKPQSLFNRTTKLVIDIDENYFYSKIE